MPSTWAMSLMTAVDVQLDRANKYGSFHGGGGDILNGPFHQSPRLYLLSHPTPIKKDAKKFYTKTRFLHKKLSRQYFAKIAYRNWVIIVIACVNQSRDLQKCSASDLTGAQKVVVLLLIWN